MDSPQVMLVIGSCGLDRLLSVPTYPQADAKVRTTSYHEVGGGNAANTATAMALLAKSKFISQSDYHLCVKLATKVGGDHVGKQLVNELINAGVDLSSPLFRMGEVGTTTGFTTILVSEQEHTRTCLHTPGTCGELTIAEVQALRMDEIFENVIHLHSDARQTNVALLLAREARRRGIPVSLDVEKDRNTEALDALLGIATIVFTNSQQIDHYLGRLTRELETKWQRKPLGDPVVRAPGVGLTPLELEFYARAIRPSAYFTRWYQDLTKEKQVVITKGSMGALELQCESLSAVEGSNGNDTSNEIAVSMDGKGLVRVHHRFVDQSSESSKSLSRIVSAYYTIHTAGVLPNPTIVDTTGSGDACIGGFLVASQVPEFKNSVHTCLAFGCWVGGTKLGGPGARSALPTAADVDTILGTGPLRVQQSLERMLTSFEVRV